ncbi:MAG: hypothetical protein LBG60_05040 [Bifidobacteriaceae bacterium]|jgi:hypothetical protein|nr:hypothetical protein [Bifidobacteriaceae bacterium]
MTTQILRSAVSSGTGGDWARLDGRQSRLRQHFRNHGGVEKGRLHQVLRVAKALPLAAAALLAGCSGLAQIAPSRPAAPGYVTLEADRYTLNVVDACPEVSISRVVVKYAESGKPFDDLQTIWAAHVADAPTRSAVLFADGDGMVVDTPAGDVDHGRDVVAWRRGGGGQEDNGRMTVVPIDQASLDLREVAGAAHVRNSC